MDVRSARDVALVTILALTIIVLAGSTAAQATQAGPVPGTEVVRGDTVPTVAHLGPTSFTRPGPLGVGETTLTLPTDGAPVEVWYPATKSSVAGKPMATYDVANWLPPSLKKLIPAGYTVSYPSGGVLGVPVAPGRYPLVVFSHGFAGFRDQSTFLTARLASWGFVVAAPDHFSRDLTEVLGGPTGATTDVADLMATISLMKAQDASASSPFHSHVDTRHVGAVGHSAGGAAVEATGRHRPAGDDVHRPGGGDGRLVPPEQERPRQRRPAPAGNAHVRDVGPRRQSRGHDRRVRTDAQPQAANPPARRRPPRVRRPVRGGLVAGRPTLHRRRPARPGPGVARAAGLRRVPPARSGAAPGVAGDSPGGHRPAAAHVRIRRVHRRPCRSRRRLPPGGGGDPGVTRSVTPRRSPSGRQVRIGSRGTSRMRSPTWLRLTSDVILGPGSLRFDPR